MNALPADDGYLSLKALAGYSGLSVKTLRGCLANPVAPLPHFRLPGKILVRRSDFDAWVLRYRVSGGRPRSSSLAAIVDDVMAGLT